MTCPACGQENPPGNRFCGRCGAELAADAGTEARKTVTVVFCDLVGSTALGERTDPEVLRGLMGRYHAELRAVLERHGGTVEKFVGDAAMAVFGLPHVHEDDALRAVRAAVEMRDAVVPLGLEVRIGVNTGEVVSGAGETLVTGDAVNVAARLEQAASAGEVLIGAATEQLVRDAVRVEAVEPLALKGKSEPVPAYRVLELLDAVPAFARPIAAPFVGREVELERLQAAFETARDERVPQLATVVGPPGIGKSRLVRELLGRAETRFLVGRCLSYGEGITYWPLAEIASQVGDLEALLARSADGELAALRVGVALGTVEATASPEEIAWGFRKLFERIADEEPLIVVLDDVHWAEPTLLDLVEHVATFASGASLFLLCTARPELFEARPAWTTPKPNATVLMLDPLESDDSETLVAELGDLSAEQCARIVDAAEGNPLFVEQLVAMHAESGDGELQIPPTLQALLAARIDRLADEERAVVERGSVEGRLFHRGAVQELLAERERADVGAHLLTLVRKELIRPDRAIVPGDDGFRFGHALIRDAAYDTIPKRQRAALHQRYADWLVARLGEEATDEIVGYHLEQAYRYGAELGAADRHLGERAAERLAAAARAARTRGDNTAIVNLLERALALVPDSPLRRALLPQFGLAVTESGSRLDEAVRGGGRARTRRRRSARRVAGTDPARLPAPPPGAGRRSGGGLPRGQGRDRRPGAGGRPRGPCKGMEPDRPRSPAARRGRRAGPRAGARNRARPGGRRLAARDRARHLDRAADDLRRRSRGRRLSLRRGRGRPARPHPGDTRVRPSRARPPARPPRRVRRRARGDGRVAQRLQRLGQEGKYGALASCVWDVCFWAENWPRGEAALRESYEMLERTGEVSFRSTVAAYLGEAVYCQGRLDEAEQLSRVSEELGASDDQVNEALWRTLRAKVAASRGDFGASEQLAREAVAIASGSDWFELAGVTWLDLAAVLLAAGKPDDARSAAEEAERIYEEKGNLVGAGRARRLVEQADATPRPLR